MSDTLLPSQHLRVLVFDVFDCGNYACQRNCLSTCFNTSCEPFRRQMWMRFQAVPASTSRARTVAPLTWWCGRDLKGTAKAQKPCYNWKTCPISGGLKLNSVKRWLGGSWQVFRSDFFRFGNGLSQKRRRFMLNLGLPRILLWSSPMRRPS